ncbi:SAM-dependent methyltransferase [Leucobacter viscericola]|uniref:S-adenosyl-L-methionine-dependent methyltransferase n=1 Tax=Leucobacter viscericola TaxID=2714935 RepID=A0A6G7XHF7_9MICO|nr:SAM-dependent methyltransferase [Leucobacter viscericola]QIK63983.1 SAM-dependent methyltransferase [Leucobacter viscericola]
MTTEVDSTALAVAVCRAVETSRSDGLIRDPFAAKLAEPGAGRFPSSWPARPEDASPLDQPALLAAVYIGLRTRFIDDVIASSAASQCVILGAGLDTRAYRLEWPVSATVFELDTPATLAYKERELAGVGPRAKRCALGVDLRHSDWTGELLGAGFDPEISTVWVIEGLFPYLDAAAQSAVLRGVVDLSAVESTVVIERAVPLTQGPDLDDKLEAFAAQTGMSIAEILARTNPPDPAELLRVAGWIAGNTGVDELQRRYSRILSLDPHATEPTGSAGRGGFVVAHFAAT